MNTITVGTQLKVVQTQKIYTVTGFEMNYNHLGASIDIVLQSDGQSTRITSELINEMLVNAEMLKIYRA